MLCGESMSINILSALLWGQGTLLGVVVTAEKQESPKTWRLRID